MEKVGGYRVSPILIHDKLESTQYALRLSPLGAYGTKEITNFLSNFDDYIFVNEISKGGKEHSHCVIWTGLIEDDVREEVRKFLKVYFPNPKRGDANKQYNLSQVEDLDLSITYLLKDATEYFTSDNVNKETIEKLKKNSYKKFSKEQFVKELEELKKRFKNQCSPLGEMMTEVMKLKALYRQPININYIHQMCLSFEIHNDLSKAEDYVRNFLSRLQ